MRKNSMLTERQYTKPALSGTGYISGNGGFVFSILATTAMKNGIPQRLTT
jgi:hypothetical protein